MASQERAFSSAQRLVLAYLLLKGPATGAEVFGGLAELRRASEDAWIESSTSVAVTLQRLWVAGLVMTGLRGTWRLRPHVYELMELGEAARGPEGLKGVAP